MGLPLHSSNGRRGLTLVEVMVASFILAVAVLAILSAFVTARRASMSADRTMEATHLARQEMENLFACDYNDTRLSIGTHQLTNINAAYTVSYSPSFTNTKDVVMTVNWVVPGLSRTASVTFASSITEYLHK